MITLITKLSLSKRLHDFRGKTSWRERNIEIHNMLQISLSFFQTLVEGRI